MAKSTYDASKDVVMIDFGEILEESDIYAELRSYDGGEPKLSVFRRVGKNKDKTKQLFRLPIKEVSIIRDFLSALDLVQILLDITPEEA